MNKYLCSKPITEKYYEIIKDRLKQKNLNL